MPKTEPTPEMIALAERCEQAEGPDRELDAAIAAAVGAEHGLKEGWCNSENGDYWTVEECAGRYSASLDAAMTLVPDDADSAGERFRLEQWNTNGVHAPHIRASAWVAGAPRVYAATPALALCAAALRARALRNGDHLHD